MGMTDREKEMADVILMLVRDNRQDLVRLTEAVSSLAASVASQESRLERLEQDNVGDAGYRVALARLEAQVSAELSSRPTFRQVLGVVGAAVALGLTLGTSVMMAVL